MTILILGLVLWWGAHLFKRLAPGRRVAMGDAGRGLVALLVLGAVVLMVLGYRFADTAVFWGRHPATVGINNLLMLLSVYLFAASGMRTRITGIVRHPQLTGFKTWAVAHLLVNGTLADIVLFGGLLAWAVVEVIVINRAEPTWQRPEPAASRKEVVAIAASLVVYFAIALIHGWIGPSVFG